MNKKIFSRFLLVAIFYAFAGFVLAANLILTAPPRETVNEGIKLYAPLAEYISKLIGSTVSYQHPGNWLNYQKDMRKDKYDIVFDDPHFVSWRLIHLKHDVLIKLPGKMSFNLVAIKGDKTIRSLNDLIGKKICAIPSPDLSSLMILTRFRNPVRQPIIHGVKGGMAKVYEEFVRGQCKVAILGNTFFNGQLTKGQRDKLRVLLYGKPLPNLSMSVSQRLSAKHKNAILQSLTLGVGIDASNAIIEHFGGKKGASFVPAKNSEYSGYNMLLEGVIFGW